MSEAARGGRSEAIEESVAEWRRQRAIYIEQIDALHNGKASRSTVIWNNGVNVTDDAIQELERLVAELDRLIERFDQPAPLERE